MCGRYNLITDAQAFVDFFELSNCLELSPRYNIAPSQQIPAVRLVDNRREAGLLHWGLIPHWAKDRRIAYKMINARAETVAEKPAFRTAFRCRRCLIPATGFFEWQPVEGGKQPYNITLREGGLMAFAGLWESWTGPDGAGIDSCAIIVTEANAGIRPIHDRMPVILNPADYALWLNPAVQDRVRLNSLLRPYPAESTRAYPVSRSLGNPKYSGPACVEPLSL
jgi:putative SOS response-associated peptidase YedK